MIQKHFLQIDILSNYKYYQRRKILVPQYSEYFPPLNLKEIIVSYFHGN